MALAIAPLTAALKAYRRRHVARRRMATVAHSIDHLPDYLRKDLGWPDRYLEQHNLKGD